MGRRMIPGRAEFYMERSSRFLLAKAVAREADQMKREAKAARDSELPVPPNIARLLRWLDGEGGEAD